MVCLLLSVTLPGCLQSPRDLIAKISPSSTSTLKYPALTSASNAFPYPSVLPVGTAEPQYAIQLFFYLPVNGPFSIGEEVSIIFDPDPILLTRLVGAEGESLGTSFVPWEVKPLELEMDYCISWDQPCPVSGSGLRIDRFVLRRKVDWVGVRRLWVTARFRNRTGEILPIYHSGTELEEVARLPLDIESTWDQSTPFEALPSPIQTLLAQTQAAYPLTGSVVWEGGRCCAGGVAGDTIHIEAEFSTSSPSGTVGEMRLRTGSRCFSEGELNQAGWEPFVPSRSFPFTLAINWIGYFISVQFQDTQGNLSPVYCDDISLEGMPPRTP